jgi:hypothetical protein
MMIKRIIPSLNVTDATAGHEFYLEFLGLEKAFDLGWNASFRSPRNQAAQVSLVSGDATAHEDSVLSTSTSTTTTTSMPLARWPAILVTASSSADR